MITFSPFRLFVFAGLITCTASSSFAENTEKLPLSTEYWKDPAFLKSFNGTYRIEARIEPNVTTEERGLLVDIQKLMAAGKREAALSTLQKSKLNSAPILFNIGNLNLELGKLDDAIKSYKAALKKYPSFRRAHRNLAVAYVRQEKNEDALVHLTEAIRLGDLDGATFGLLGYCRLEKDQYMSALQAYRFALMTQPEVADWKAGVARCLQHLNQNEEGIALLDEVIDQRPLAASYSVLKANLHLSSSDPESAVTALELPYRLGVLSADSTLLLADLHLRAARKQEALEKIKTAFSKEKEQPSLRSILQVISTAAFQRDWELTESLLAKTDPESDDSALLLARSKFLFDSEKNKKRALEISAELTDAEPTNGRALFLYASQLRDSGETGKSALIFERASSDPATAYQSFTEIARLQVSQTRYEDALKSIDRALEIRPSRELETYRIALSKTAEAAR